MRRTEHDGHAARQGPRTFKVLAPPDITYLSPPPPSSTPPPPSRAPEPYKVAPSTTSFGRAHRRSSFVILAESRPATPESENASPTLPTGRVSPFRGRGFKGPPPHSMSRPQSPEVAADGRRRGRVERRGKSKVTSVSPGDNESSERILKESQWAIFRKLYEYQLSNSWRLGQPSLLRFQSNKSDSTEMLGSCCVALCSELMINDATIKCSDDRN